MNTIQAKVTISKWHKIKIHSACLMAVTLYYLTNAIFTNYSYNYS